MESGNLYLTLFPCKLSHQSIEVLTSYHGEWTKVTSLDRREVRMLDLFIGIALILGVIQAG